MRLALLLAAVLAVPAAAQVRTADVVAWRVRADRAAAGGQARVVFDATIAPGWRMYALGSAVGIPLTVTLDALPGGVRAGAVRQSSARQAHDPVFDADYAYFAETGRVVQLLAVGAGAEAGTHEVSGAVRYAVCDD